MKSQTNMTILRPDYYQDLKEIIKPKAVKISDLAEKDDSK